MTWRRAVRPAIDRIAKYSGLLRACERRMGSKITVLMYHRVLEDAECADYPFPELVVPRSFFEAQLDYLERSARVMPVSDALQGLRDTPRDSRPLVCLTFDDGYVDNFEIAAALLEARGFRATFFITAGAIHAQTPLWYDRAALVWNTPVGEKIHQGVSEGNGSAPASFATREAWIEWLKAIPNDRRERLMAELDSAVDLGASRGSLMTADQVRRLAERGHEIGSHTLWHPILTTMRAEDRSTEIEQAKELLELWTGREVAGFCYPNGDFDTEVIRQVDEAGHRYACTTRPGLNDDRTDPFQLRRIDMNCDRVTARDGGFDALAFRAEISLLREWMRGGVQLRDWVE